MTVTTDVDQPAGGAAESLAGMTDAEQSYFNSRGEDASGLGLPPAQPGAAASAAGNGAAPAAAQPPVPQPGATPPLPGVQIPVDPEAIFDDAGKPTKGFVPYAALRDERTRRAELQRQNAIITERFNMLNALLQNQQQGAQAQQQPAPSAPPNPKDDPFAYIEYADKELSSLKQYVAQNQAAEQQRSALQQVTSIYGADARRFAAEAPDFQHAYVHLIGSRDHELQLAGVVNPSDRERMIKDEELQIVARYLQANQSPAQAIYQLAMARGYRPQPAAAPAPAAVAAPASGAAPAAPVNGNGAANGGAVTAVAEIERIKQGQQRSRSLSHASGAPGNQLTPEVLGNMPALEFEALYSKLSKAERRAMLGGAN